MFEAKCRRRGQHIKVIDNIAEQRIKDALLTRKKPPNTLAYMTTGRTTVSPSPEGIIGGARNPSNKTNGNILNVHLIDVGE